MGERVGVHNYYTTEALYKTAMHHAPVTIIVMLCTCAYQPPLNSKHA